MQRDSSPLLFWTRAARPAVVIGASLLLACGGTGGSGHDAGVRDAGPGDGAASDADVTPITIPGVWQVDGQDGIGSYTGQIELSVAGNRYDFTRVIRYTGTTVEDVRELWWVFRGTATPSGTGLDLAASLQKADFIRSRGVLSRTDADRTPVAVSGTFAQTGRGFAGSFTGPDLAASETWSSWMPSGAPIFPGIDRQIAPAHGVPGNSEKALAFEQYASYHALPEVAPYVNHPDFQAAIHGYYIDRTDAQFYLDHPAALRVVQKIIDPISLQETLARANAFRYTLAGKAAFFDAETPARFIEPVGGMVVAARQGNGLEPSGDAALWTGVYVASQAFRYQVTGEATALTNLVKSLESLLTCQEITGDSTTFARSLVPIAALPNDPEWHAGTGAYANLAWKQGGNNDMLKGLLYGYLTGYLTLCTGLPGYDALCERIRTNAYNMADFIGVAQSGNNRLTSQWLAGYVRNEGCPLFNPNHRTRATTEWIVLGTTVSLGNGMTYTQFTGADWSGTHLNAVQYLVLVLLSRNLNLCSPYGNVEGTVKDGIGTGHGQIDAQRLVLWHLLYSAFVSGANPSALTDARLRLQEEPAPKTGAQFDHRIHPDFVLSPYPALPWKLDWTTTDRTQALRGRPLFEQPSGEHYWKENPFAYKGDSAGTESPGVDYLHAYWLGRRFGVLGADE